MPVVKQQSALAKKLADRIGSAISSHKDDETTLETKSRFLPDIDGGVAQLVDLRVGYYDKGDNKGEPYVIAIGSIVSPKQVESQDGQSMITVFGRQIKWGPEPLCETKWANSGDIVSFDEHMSVVLTLLRSLGLNTKDLADDGSDLEPSMAALLESAPYFRFRVYTMPANPPQYPKAKYKEEWGKQCEFVADGDDGVVEAVTKPSANGKPTSTKTVAGAQASKKGTAAKGPLPGQKEIPFGSDWDDVAVDASNEDENISTPAQDKLEEAAIAAGYTKAQVTKSESWEQVAGWIIAAEKKNKGSAEKSKEVPGAETAPEDDVDALAEAAEGGDQEAADKLDELRQLAGIDDETYAASGWVELAELLKGGEAGAEGSEDDAAVAPAPKEVWKYRPMVMDPKKKKMVPAEEAVECVVISVDATAETCVLKNLETGKIFMDMKTKKALSIQWSELEAG